MLTSTTNQKGSSRQSKAQLLASLLKMGLNTWKNLPTLPRGVPQSRPLRVPKRKVKPLQIREKSYSAPVALGETTVSRGARVSSQRNSTRVKHKELVFASIPGSTGFALQTFVHINPGIPASFPWLAGIAKNWEQYVVHRLEYSWVPIAPTSTQGDVILSPNYDASDPPPTTETQAVNCQGTITFPCWAPNRLVLDPKALMALGPRRYVRQSAVAGDIKTFDVANVAICSNNETGTSVIGKVFVEYDIEFFIPQNDPSGATQPLYTSVFVNSGVTTITNGINTTLLWNTVRYDPLQVGSAAISSTGIFTPPAGVYNVSYFVNLDDNFNENCLFTAWVEESGSIIGLAPTFNMGGASAGPGCTCVCMKTLVCSGADTVKFRCNVTGFAGVMTYINPEVYWTLA